MGNNNPLHRGGDKPIKMDFETFKKRSINQKMSSEDQLKNYLQKLEANEREIKKYRYHQDFDRIDYANCEGVATSDIMSEKVIQLSLIMGFLIARRYVTQVFRQYRSFAIEIRYTLFFGAWFSALGYYVVYHSQPYHLINSPQYRMNRPEIQLYRAFDQHQNLYHYVDDIKYNFDYSKNNIGETMKKYNKDADKFVENEYLRIFRERYGSNKKSSPQ